MKLITISILLFLVSILPSSAQENCLSPQGLEKLDAAWEKALKELDVAFLENTLSENFIWVHTHAVKTDTKKSLLEEVNNNLNSTVNNTRSRISKDVKIMISGATGIVSGFTTVDRGPKPITYHFMRTYIQEAEKCYLIANHTMALPEVVTTP